MTKKILQVVTAAHRCTLEEQDDPVLWITAVMRGAGGDHHVLLRDNAVGYAVRGQDASGLVIGGRPQTQPPRLDDDVARLLSRGAQIFVVEEDVAERGLQRTDLVPGVTPVARAALADLYGGHDQIWSW